MSAVVASISWMPSASERSWIRRAQTQSCLFQRLFFAQSRQIAATVLCRLAQVVVLPFRVRLLHGSSLINRLVGQPLPGHAIQQPLCPIRIGHAQLGPVKVLSTSTAPHYGRFTSSYAIATWVDEALKESDFYE